MNENHRLDSDSCTNFSSSAPFHVLQSSLGRTFSNIVRSFNRALLGWSEARGACLLHVWCTAIIAETSKAAGKAECPVAQRY